MVKQVKKHTSSQSLLKPRSRGPGEPCLSLSLLALSPHHCVPGVMASKVGVDVFSEGGSYRQGILGAQDHRTGSPGDSW